MYMAHKPFYQGLYSVAYVISGNERKSNEIILGVMLSNPYPDATDAKILYESVKDAAVHSSKPEDGEYFSFSGAVSETLTPLSEALLSFSDEENRIFLMRFALNLSIRDISSVTGKKSAQISETLIQYTNYAVSFVKTDKAASGALRRAAYEMMDMVSIAPDYNALIRSAEVLTEKSKTPAQYKRKIKSLLSMIFALLFLTAAAVIIWLTVLFADHYRSEYVKPRETETESVTLYAEDSTCPFLKV